MMTTDGSQKRPTWRGYIRFAAGFLGLFAGLCAVFALFVTAGEGWAEQAQARWPRATARVERCGLDIYSHRQQSYWIDCSVRYAVRGEEVVAKVHSRSTPSPQRVIWQYPAGQFERMQEWVEEHPETTAIVVHYDPAHPGTAVLVETDMPLGGPHTPDNAKVLELFGVSCVVLLGIARVARPRVAAVRRA